MLLIVLCTSWYVIAPPLELEEAKVMGVACWSLELETEPLLKAPALLSLAGGFTLPLEAGGGGGEKVLLLSPAQQTRNRVKKEEDNRQLVEQRWCIFI